MYNDINELAMARTLKAYGENIELLVENVNDLENDKQRKKARKLFKQLDKLCMKHAMILQTITDNIDSIQEKESGYKIMT